MLKSYRLSILLSLFSLLLLLSACGQATSSTTPSGTGTAQTLKDVSIGLGYIPDVQFAPFYVAQSKGYYAEAGLNVTFNHGIVPDLIGSMIAKKNDFVFAGGDELLEAQNKNKGLQVVDVATIFQKYPVSLIVPASSSIKTLADLKGHTIGVPGPYGSTYTGLLALLYKANLSLSDVKVQYINFTQVQALLNNRVDAVIGYSNNEPLQIQQHGMAVRTFDVSDYQPLISNGIITTVQMNQSEPQVVKSFVQATLKGLQDVINDPPKAVEVSKQYVKTLTDSAQALKVLQATIPIWQSSSGKLGYNDSATWKATQDFLVAIKAIDPVQNLAQVYSNQALS